MRILNSTASAKGFLKSIGAALAPPILNGPLGCGAVLYPISMQLYSPPSALTTVN